RCRFAGAVRTDQCMAFALRHAQIDVLENGDVAKALVDFAEFDRSAHAAIPFSRAVLVARFHASCTQTQVLRAIRYPPTMRTADIAQIDGLAASKAMPNAL